MKICTPLWREAHLQVNTRFGPLLDDEMSKKGRLCGAKRVSKNTNTFGSFDVEKEHAVAARSTFRRQTC
jgi:hypothetical protein